ncbi:PIN domain-like protein [Trichocladium antarcticum]|uniref:PIN domain-like protein n=1 Tax=Trichocladium antarcticum TaxID=1450529 RepID=A0AAN6ZBM1_9PEZI|nr:PIN domain-like protein [Trichocladium antarcticum]
MGVQGLWTVVQPCARPTNLSTLNRKRLAIDASIWIYQFLKAVRDKEGNALRSSHVVGFFRRICKLLWYGVKPVFVFDGGAPSLKRATLQGRRRRREGRREDAARTAGKLLVVQMQRVAAEDEEKRRRVAAGADAAVDEEQEPLPSMDQIVYADELGMSEQERQTSRRFHKQDAYHLPALENGIEAMGKPNDPRIMSVDELEEYARQFSNGEDINLYDFGKIDFDGEFFKSLPPADRYNILNAARLRSRLRMGLSKDQLDGMFPDRMAFSRFQIERVTERNHLTQRLMHELGMTGLDLTINVNRVAGDMNREYILVKNEGAEGGWALGVVSREKDRGQIHKPIDVDALDFQYQGQNDGDESEDAEFEDVPIEGLNRLPKHRPVEEGVEESLFVGDGNATSLFGDGDLQADEDEDLSRAIALSLQNQHSTGSPSEEAGNDEDAPAPEWTQEAVEAPKPIISTSGRMVAHIVNNRAGAAVPRRRDSGSSNSDVDLQSALAAARKKQPRPVPAPVVPNVTNPFEGPLPFEKLDWRTAFGAKPAPAAADTPAKPRDADGGDLDAVSYGEAGGFVLQNKDKPLPLPPWLTDNTDIRESVKKQQETERELNARAAEMEEELVFEDDDGVIELDSSSEDGSDIEILDAAPPIKQSARPIPGASLPSLQDNVVRENAREPIRDVPPEQSDDDAGFEDVALALQPPRAAELDDAEMCETARIEAELYGDGAATPEQETGIDSLLGLEAPAPHEFDDSDPEEDELMVQMAEEVEEHARFANQLNNKSEGESRDTYEQELRALRSQQKKDRRDADEVTQIMVSECQALLRLFGIPYITAPMEAEAQCAELVRLNLVDGIVTDDSDIFLFGGTRVYKNMFNSNKFVECYLARDLETELSLSRDTLIAVAQLLGSDYTEGVPGVGPVTALEILSEFPNLATFKDWWQDVQNRGRAREADAASPFRRRFRKAHAARLFLPAGFPSPAVADAYRAPEVDSSPEAFRWGVPNLDALRRFLMATVGWDRERTDEVLVPVIRDMNRREAEGTQSNITRYFEGGVGLGPQGEAFAPRQRVARGSRRMAEAVGRLRASAAGGVPGGMPVAAPPKAVGKTGRKRKATEKETETAGDEEEEGAEDGGGGGGESGSVEGKGWRKRGGRGTGRGGRLRA